MQRKNNRKGRNLPFQVIILTLIIIIFCGVIFFIEYMPKPKDENNTFIIYKFETSYISQKYLGNVISGSDANSVIQETINSMHSGDTIKFRPAVYPILHTIIGKSNIRMEGEEGVVWDCSSLPDNSPVLVFNERIRNVTEVITSTVSDAHTGATLITVLSPSGFEVGDMVQVFTNAVWKNNERLQKQGEIRWITGITGSTFTLEKGIEDNYLLTNSTSVRRINPVKNVIVSNLKFLGRVGGANLTCLEFEEAFNITVTGCIFEKFEKTSILYSSVIDSKVTNNTFIKSYMDGFGYGVAIEYACQNILAEYNVGYECRHTITIGGGAKLYGIPRHLMLQYNKSYDSAWNSDKGIWLSSGAAFDSHNVGEDVNYLYNESYDGHQGFSCSFYTGRVHGNKVYNSHNLGMSFGSNSRTYSENVTVSNNLIQTTGAMGIYVHEPNVLIEGNEIYDAGWQGIRVWDRNLDSLSNIKIYNNTIKGSGTILDSSYANIEINNAINPEIWNNTIRKTYLDSTKRTTYGILLSGPITSNGNTIAGCIGANVYDNDLTDAGERNNVVDKGIGSIFTNNIGYP